MSNSICLLIYSPFLIITLILFFNSLKSDRKGDFFRYNRIFYSVLLSAHIFEVLYHLFPSPVLTEYFLEAGLVFSPFIPIPIFFMLSAFYRLDRFFPKWTVAAICFIPVVTALLAATSHFHSLLIKGYSFAAAQPLVSTTIVFTPWYDISLIYNELLMLAAAIAVSIYYRNLPRAYREGSLFMLSGVIVYSLGLLSQNVFSLVGAAINPVLITANIAGILFFFATIAKGKTDYLSINQRDLFNFLDKGILILDGSGRIVDMNHMAKTLLSLIGQYSEKVPFYDFLEESRMGGQIVRKRDETEGGEDIYITNKKYPVIYQMTSQPILDKAGKIQGRFVIFTNVTNNRLSMTRLKEMAGEDPLLGIPNRFGYQQLLQQLDRGEFLPLTVIVGTVNNLKKVNDTYGHFKGDILLKNTVALLKKCCDDQGYITRTGGDEFTVLLPQCSLHKRAEIIKGINQELEDSFDSDSLLSLSLRCITKVESVQNLNVLINMSRHAPENEISDLQGGSTNE